MPSHANLRIWMRVVIPGGKQSPTIFVGFPQYQSLQTFFSFSIFKRRGWPTTYSPKITYDSLFWFPTPQTPLILFETLRDKWMGDCWIIKLDQLVWYRPKLGNSSNICWTMLQNVDFSFKVFLTFLCYISVKLSHLITI